MDPPLRTRIESVWADRLACPPSLFQTPGIHLIAHPQPAVLYAVLVGNAAIVAAPPELHAALLDLPRPAAAVDAEALGRLVPGEARWVGPAFVGYTATRPPPPAIDVREVALAELKPLRRTVSATGRAAVTASLAHALDQEHLAQYQTLLANRGAMSIARALGFEAFAKTLSARWRSA